MKFTWFHLMPWPHMPDDFRQKHRSVWVDLPSRMYDPELGHIAYHQYLDQLEYAESVGFDGIGVNEHHANAYGLLPSPNIMAATLTRRTSKAELVVLGNSIALYNPPIRVAEEFAMLDVLSGGRLVVGIGAGWLKTEFDAVVTTPFPERGAVTDEYIDAFRVLWTERAPRFAGRYTKFDGIVLEPKPVQRPHPPIWVGGESGPAVRRAARVGDAWYPIGSHNQHLLDTLPRLRAGIARLRKATTDAGRDPASVGVGYRVKRYGAAVPPIASDGERRLFSGSEADIIGDLRALRDMGVAALDIDFGRPDAAAVITEMRRFRAAVIDKI